MLNQVGWGEIAVILLLTLFVVGPERLPGLAADAGKNLRKARDWMRGMSGNLKEELGPEFADVNLADLHPKTFVKKHLMDDLAFSEEDKQFWREPWQDGPEASLPASAAAPLSQGELPPWDPDTT